LWHSTIVEDNLWYLSKWRPFWRPHIWQPPRNAWSGSATELISCKNFKVAWAMIRIEWTACSWRRRKWAKQVLTATLPLWNFTAVLLQAALAQNHSKRCPARHFYSQNPYLRQYCPDRGQCCMFPCQRNWAASMDRGGCSRRCARRQRISWSGAANRSRRFSNTGSRDSMGTKTLPLCSENT